MEKMTSCYLLFSCWYLVARFFLDVASYTIEITTNRLLNNPMKPVQNQ